MTAMVKDVPAADPVSDRQAEPVLICDDMAALATSGMSPRPDTEIWSFSPAAGSLGLDHFAYADRDMTSDDLAGVFQLSLDLAAVLHDTIAAGAEPDAADRAMVAAALAVQFQPVLYIALCLTRAAARRPITFVVVDHGDAMLNQRFNGAAAELAERLPGVTIARIAAPMDRRIVQPAPPSAGLLDRLRFNPWQSHAYRLEKSLSDRLPLRGRKGTMLILRENELLKESAFYLARRGYAIRSLPTPPARTGPPCALRTAIIRPIEARIGALFPPDAAHAVAAFLAEKVCAAEQDYANKRAGFEAALSDAEPMRPRAVLTNLIGPVNGAALHAACRAKGMPSIMFQHGVTPEICQPVSRLWPSIEAAVSDLVCCFNQAVADLGNRSAFRAGNSVAVGMPRELRHSVGKRVASAGPPIWYVSTGLYRGRNALLHLAEPDHRIAAFETRIVDQVLSRLPHRVMYKPYPSVRYADGDPVADHARRGAGITVYENRGDFRFLAARSRVIVTARATSTLSWCVMSDRPVVFIDTPTQSPLLPEARRLAEQALFVFDAGEPDFETELRTFLSKSIEEIERLWHERAAVRQEYVDRFLDTNHGPAGRLAADAVEDLIARHDA